MGHSKTIMKLLVSDKEIVNYLLSNLDYSTCVAEDLKHYRTHINEVIGWWCMKKDKDGTSWNEKKWAPKLKDKLKKAVESDLRQYIEDTKNNINNKKEKNKILVSRNLNYLLEKLGSNVILKQYKISNVQGFVKSTGLHIDKNAVIQRRAEFTNITDDCVLRNTAGNENFLISKIDNQLPFWFIDSGYTNFIESNKKWHRLVKNHLHSGMAFDAPVDRLKNFNSFPVQWRTTGSKILIIEPGPFAANIFHVNLKTWKYEIEEELRKYTDKTIVFREKAPKKKRESLYNHLLTEDYYCVININSNAATEAIWAGVPTITLDRHISNSVTKSKISDINNLYRGPLASWLAMLSYSQFTYEELVNGTAVNILKKYHV